MDDKGFVVTGAEFRAAGKRRPGACRSRPASLACSPSATCGPARLNASRRPWERAPPSWRRSTACLPRNRRARIMRMRALAIAVLLAVLSVPLLAGAEKQAQGQRASRGQALDAIRGDPLALHAFLKRMPKGADLHNHLDGAVYAETFIRVGGEDGLCVDPAPRASASRSRSSPVPSRAAGLRDRRGQRRRRP